MNLKVDSKSKKKCFVIAPIGADNSDTRKRSDLVLKYVFQPPLEESGYEVIRADKIDNPGMITTQVIDHVVNDDLVIADLTENNPNVFYEIAIRHAVSKPFIQVMQVGEKIPFDISDLRTIIFDYKDLESVDNAKIQIRQQIKAIQEPQFRVVTPLTFAVDLKSFESSGDKEEYYIANIMSELSKLNNRFIKMEESFFRERSKGERNTMMRHIQNLEMERNELRARLDEIAAPELDDEIPF